MLVANVHQAKTQLSKLLDEVSKGKEVVIAKAGKPVARLTAYQESKQPRKPGLLKGKIFVPDNFTNEDEEINEMFYGPSADK